MIKMKQNPDFIGPVHPPKYLTPEMKLVFLRCVYKDWWVEHPSIDEPINLSPAFQQDRSALDENNSEATAEGFYRAAVGLDGDISTIIKECAGAVTVSERIYAVLPQKILDDVTSATRLARALIA